MSNANQLELGLLALINAERAAAGLSPLRLITVLNDAAESHSAWMLQTDDFSHTGAGGTSAIDRMTDAGYPFQGRILALENIGWQSLRAPEGAGDEVARLHAGLMASDGHRANILNAEVTDIGIGVGSGPVPTHDGDVEAVMVTQVFGRTDADVSALIDAGMVATEDVMNDPTAGDDPTESGAGAEPTSDGTDRAADTLETGSDFSGDDLGDHNAAVTA
ncbi:MAG: CAP domain-containing protein, partial [Silicimonas sp.]|nr:CAP domain-containing protein [Silicimonas sp.]